jgi:hypothetical protein
MAVGVCVSADGGWRAGGGGVKTGIFMSFHCSLPIVL